VEEHHINLELWACKHARACVRERENGAGCLGLGGGVGWGRVGDVGHPS